MSLPPTDVVETEEGRRGVAEYNLVRCAAAVPLLQAAWQKGDALAGRRLAACYQLAMGVAKDEARAKEIMTVVLPLLPRGRSGPR